ncbi:hypothetical protein C7B76_15445 [filamentous cyanobacterium CCP2]|nr:hypothetical protein C7B76_15445 [filamentous cyanobacterium CCP2]
MTQLTVSPNRHYLLKEDGTPFFYLGDTAWELFHRLNREEAQLYLENRAAKGFTVIQAVVLAELDGLDAPNPYGHTPLQNNDPTCPNEAYFQHVDFIVETAARLGLYVGMLPTWGDKVHWLRGTTPEIFTPETAQVYGEFLGQRYQDQPIIWILGGDRDPKTDGHLAIWRAMAAGLKAGDRGKHLMTFHCQSNSAQWFHNDDWLDFNLFQSGHGEKNCPCHQTVTANYHRSPVKPTLNGEPCYEDIPVRFWEINTPYRKWNKLPIVRQITRQQRGVFDDYDVRQAAYWSLLAGACGHTYGHNSVWQMWEPGRLSFVPAQQSWQEALDRPGAVQMGYVRRLFESRPFTQLIPDQAILSSNLGKGANDTLAARAEDGSFLFVYIPTGNPVRVRLTAIQGNSIAAYWYDPRTGKSQAIGMISNQREQEFHPPSQGHGQDWILVLDNAESQFPLPGS